MMLKLSNDDMLSHALYLESTTAHAPNSGRWLIEEEQTVRTLAKKRFLHWSIRVLHKNSCAA